MDELTKIYVEPTNRCNLKCVACIRNSWDELVGDMVWPSPCPALLHSYTCFIRNREKFFRRCEFGRLPEEPLTDIWLSPEYAAFRERVRTFDFSPCTDCGGCDLGERNEEDCFGNPFPVCGDCLWARGVLRCA